MNILFITQLFPADKDINNTSEALREFVTEWAKKGHQIKVIRPYYSYEKEPFPVKATFKIEQDVFVEFVKPLRIPILKFGFFNNKKIIKNLTFKPDVVVCHMYNSYFTFHKLAKILNVPLVVGIHMSDIRISKNVFHWFHQKQIFKNVSAFACRSIAIQNLFHKYFPEYKKKTFLAFSGLPQIYLNQNIEVKRNQKIRIISVSWLIKRKQIDKVIKALAKMPADLQWEYVVIGTGEEDNSLKQLVNEINLSTAIHFPGKKSRESLMEELKQSDIFVLPSYDETFGLVYLEAMACGCLTIGSRNEGIDGIIIDGHNGLLCDPLSDDSIFAKLYEAMVMDEDNYKKMVSTGIESISNYSIEKKSGEYLDRLLKL